jgi:Alpha 1,4-glycosyltransferase conserved region
MDGSGRSHQKFQSFWHGGALSPYEQFCLKSFVDCGHAVDLYTYDNGLVAPAGVRVCDAAEFINPDEVFVYQAEGFGKGSPSAFSNFFRYTLLAEKGGWWIDTDVVCLTDRIPIVDEFFARQDADYVNCGIMYFEPRHPVMTQCREQTIKLGRAVKWGDAGPHLLTQVLQERGSIDRALPASVCYPIHYSQALDLLRPSRTAALSAQVESSLFLHVWNSMLVFRGVKKTCRPPTGSLLRKWTDKHPVDGWVGEYDEQTLESAVEMKAELDASVEQKARLQTALEFQIAEGQRLQQQLADAAAMNEQYRTQLGALWESASWRLTAPLRVGGRHLSALRRLGRHR